MALYVRRARALLLPPCGQLPTVSAGDYGTTGIQALERGRTKGRPYEDDWDAGTLDAKTRTATGRPYGRWPQPSLPFRTQPSLSFRTHVRNLLPRSIGRWTRTATGRPYGRWNTDARTRTATGRPYGRWTLDAWTLGRLDADGHWPPLRLLNVPTTAIPYRRTASRLRKKSDMYVVTGLTCIASS